MKFCSIQLVLLSLFILGTLSYEPPVVSAQSSNTRIMGELSSYLLNPDYTPSGRSRFARLLGSYCKGVLESLPTNTPKEDVWVETEMKTFDYAKVMRVIATPEWGRRQLKFTFISCVEETNGVLRTQASRKGDARAHEEAMAYLRITNGFDDSDIPLNASNIKFDSTAWGINLLPMIRRTLVAAALRTLDSP